MSRNVLTSKDSVQDGGRSDWNINAMIEELFNEMNGSVSRSIVEQTLVTLFANYEDAPIKRFVPILVRRQAKDLLREEAATGS